MQHAVPPAIIDWQRIHAAVWRRMRTRLQPVTALDPVALADLIGIDAQKQALLDNLQRFTRGVPANHMLLWGARGTGKSSLVKAAFNALRDQGLRLVQLDQEDLPYLPEIVDDLRVAAYRFIVFCDDLSFDAPDLSYKALKTLLEGTIEQPPANVLFVATSNRRHLLPEYMQENLEAQQRNGEIHPGESVEEKHSLADRFGLWLSFYALSQDEYLAIVDHVFADSSLPRQSLHRDALRFALARGVRSGRTARQFHAACGGGTPPEEVPPPPDQD